MTMPDDDPHANADSWYAIAQNHNCGGQFAEAVAAYSTALECDPHHAKARLGRGLALQQTGEHEAAIRDFTDVVQRFPKWAGLYITYYSRAYSYKALGRLTAAVDDCNQVMQGNPDHIDALYLRGVALKELGDFEHAAEDLNAVIEADPTYHEAYYARGTLFYMQRRWEEAIADLSDFLRHASPADGIVVDSHRLRGIAAFELGRNQAALEDLSLAIEANSTDASTYMRRSQVFKAMGDSDRAEVDFKKANSLLSSG
jgi:tetratricopeptide (TPR) repeat protein